MHFLTQLSLFQSRAIARFHWSERLSQTPLKWKTEEQPPVSFFGRRWSSPMFVKLTVIMRSSILVPPSSTIAPPLDAKTILPLKAIWARKVLASLYEALVPYEAKTVPLWQFSREGWRLSFRRSSLYNSAITEANFIIEEFSAWRWIISFRKRLSS